MDDRNETRVDVVPLLALSRAGKEYTYGVPDVLTGRLKPGMLVKMRFRGRPATGVVTGMGGRGEVARILDIDGVQEDEPVLLPYQLDLARWIAEEFVAPLSDVLGSMLPPIMKRLSVPRAAQPSHARITPAGRVMVSDSSGLKRAPAQRAVLEQLADAGDWLGIASLINGKPAPMAALRALKASGLAELDTIEQSDPRPEPIDRPRLSDDQATAVHAIVHALPDPSQSKGGIDSVFLLHGVTGSGKTEVYMSAIEEALGRGESALMLVPEISLTPQALHRFAARFPGMTASVHSGMGSSDRRREWQRLRSGEARIAIGPRSAIFSPLANLGIIILDEEHDSAYKQEESPRYHARDVAIRLGQALSIPVVLGSATPDVGSYYHARKERYRLLELPDRPVWDVGGRDEPSSSGALERSSRPMPSVDIVDLRQELKAGNRSIFSRRLEAALEETLASGHQAMLFLNRRGSSTSVVCRDCGYVATCEACDLPLTYHSFKRALICHRCDRRSPPPNRCPSCGSERIRYLGVGTQRVAEEVSRAHPDARVLRWDRDVASKSNSHEAIAHAFSRHEADVLVGTQMIAKGLDFPLVTLVGVIVADVGLNLPDFRAAERTFQLMTQVAGRAGRADLPSRVIVQAYNPDHYALQAAKDHDYWSFYRQEMTFRHGSGYPPYSRLVRFLVKGRDDSKVGRQAHSLRDTLRQRIQELGDRSVELIGPAPAFTSRINNVYQWHLLLRGSEIHGLIDGIPDEITVDIDPVDLL